jgi:hypothetical protein
MEPDPWFLANKGQSPGYGAALLTADYQALFVFGSVCILEGQKSPST